MELNKINITTNKTRAVRPRNINLHEQDEKNNTLLHLAAARGDLNKAGYLINRYPYLLEAKNKFGSTPLHYATWFGQFAMVKYLVAQGASLKIKDNFNQSLLHAAAFNGHVDLVEFFVKNGLSLEDKDQRGNTPLLSAASNTHFPVVKFLTSVDADIHAQNNEGDNIFLIAAQRGALKILDYFVFHKKIDLSIFKDKENNTLLHLAVLNNRSKLVKYLFYQKLSLEAKNNDENTPLHLAVENNDTDLAMYLLSVGADIEAKNIDGNTPLKIAIANREKDLVEYLIQKGAQLDQESAHYVELHKISTPEKLGTLSDNYVLREAGNSKNVSPFSSNSVKKKRSKRRSDISHQKNEFVDDDFFSMQKLNESLASLSNTSGFFRNNSTEVGGAYALNSSVNEGTNNLLTNYRLDFLG